MGGKMKINPKIKKLHKEKNKSRRDWCKYCCDAGCDDPGSHDLKLMQFAYDLGKEEK